MNQFNNKGELHGYWERYWDNGNLHWTGNFINSKFNGKFEWYNNNSELIEKEFYL
jgi:antitoxin component YwqK of YwqJK toxin-antitoxin module